MSRKAVNTPIDPELRDRDVKHKLQLYGIYSAFANGKVPTNKQIDVALNSLLGSKALNSPSEDLSSESREIIEDIKEVIANARNLILVKNEGHLIQEFIWEAENTPQPTSARQPGSGVDRDAEKQGGAQAAEDLRTLGTLLITNGQFRKLLSDAAILLRDMAGETAQRATDVIRPSQDQLAQIDEPAEEGVWHEKPDISKGTMKSQMQSIRKKGREVETSGREEVPLVSQPVGETYGRPLEAGGEVDGVTDEKAGGIHAGVNGTGKGKGKTKDMADKTKSFLAEKMPPERREQTIWRLKKMIVEIQGHSDYQRAVDSLLSLAESYATRWRDSTKQGTGQMKGAREESGTRSLESKLRVLIERFANCTSAADLFESIQKIARDADKDDRLKHWFRSMDTFIRKCLREQGYVLQDEATEEWRHLHAEGRYLFRDRYREDANRVIGELKFLGDQFNQDPLNRALRQSLQKLWHDLGYDESGNMAFKKDVAKDFTSIILPGMVENLRYVPVPRIEVCDPMVDVVIENLAIECDNLMPNVVEFSSDNYWRWGRKKIGNKHDNKVMISATGMQTDWKDVSYYVRKKKGFPLISDRGVMDVFLGGEGFSFRIIGTSTRDQDTRRFIKAEQVSVTIRHLDIKLKKSRHKVLFGLSRPLLLSVLRPAVQKALEKQIRDYFNKADEFAYEIDKEARRTRELARNDPEDTRNMYSHYFNAFRSRLLEQKQQRQKRKEEKEATTTETQPQTHVAMTEYDSMFKDIKLPGAISTKASEYKDLAAKGERWESPVFSIGTASQTPNLPKISSIKRKPHTIATDSQRSGDSHEPTYGETNGHPSRGVDGGVLDGTARKVQIDGGAHGPKVDGSHTILGTPCPV